MAILQTGQCQGWRRIIPLQNIWFFSIYKIFIIIIIILLGPKRDFMEWSKRDGFGVAEEAANRIRHGGNEQLWKLFKELHIHQALL